MLRNTSAHKRIASEKMVDCVHSCPCGYFSDTVRACTCSHQTVTHYQKRISGPMLDRIDIHIEVPRVDFEKLSDNRRGESSDEIRARVEVWAEADALRRVSHLDSLSCLNWPSPLTVPGPIQIQSIRDRAPRFHHMARPRSACRPGNFLKTDERFRSRRSPSGRQPAQRTQ